MEPNSGIVVGPLRILLTSGTARLWEWPARTLTEGVLGGQGWKLTVQSVSDGELLAARSFSTEAEATEVRRQFADAVSAGLLDGEDADLQQTLDLLAPPAFS